MLCDGLFHVSRLRRVIGWSLFVALPEQSLVFAELMTIHIVDSHQRSNVVVILRTRLPTGLV